jgi:hypothetical protein
MCLGQIGSILRWIESGEYRIANFADKRLSGSEFMLATFS